jgi:hypothetical protein
MDGALRFSAAPSSAPPLSAVEFAPMQGGMDLLAPQQAYAPVGPEPVVQPRLIQYYVEHVRRTQFPLATDAVDQTLQAVCHVTPAVVCRAHPPRQVATQDPQGALAFALCALAALHYSRVQSAHGVSDAAGADFGDSKAFHDRAFYLVASAPQVGGHYTELDALAAAHLVLYALMSGGLTDWAQPLEIACEWLAGTSLIVDENPRTSLMAMGPAARLAAKLALVSVPPARRPDPR